MALLDQGYWSRLPPEVPSNFNHNLCLSCQSSSMVYLVSGVRFTSPKALEHTVQSEYCSWQAKNHSGHDHIALGILAPSIFIEKYLHIDHYAINCFNSIFTQKKKLRTLHHDKGITLKGNFSSVLSVSPNFHKQRKFSD